MDAWEPPRGRVLVLAPHPDDESLGCGGALLLHRRRGDRVKVVFVTDGEAGDPRGYYRGLDLASLRRREARRAAKILGVGALEFWGCPDGRLARAKDLGRRLRALLLRERPAVVYRPSRRDPHPDHRALARRFERAKTGLPRAFADFSYEVCFMLEPSAVVDVGKTFPRKALAIRQYRSQLRYRDYVGLAAKLGVCRSLLLPGSRQAEAFRLA